MNVRAYALTLTDITIKRSDIERALNHDPQNPSGPWTELIDEVLIELPQHCHICGGYVIVDRVKFIPSTHAIHLADEVIHPDKIVYGYLRKAEKIAVFTCTAGPVGEWSKELMSQGNLLKGYVVDVVANEVVETAMDVVGGSLQEEISEEGFSISTRYSPGYCNWNVSEQHQLFNLLPNKFCGVELLPSGLMIPMKSISGIIGIGSEVRALGYSCQLCKDNMCIYRGKIERKAALRRQPV